MNKWTTFVKEWAAKNNLSYGCAMTKPECKDEYRKANPKPIKITKKRQKRFLKAKDVSYESLEEAIPTEVKKPINLKIKKLAKEPPPKKVTVHRIKIKEKEYYIDKDDNLYDPATKEHIGMFAGVGKDIIPLEESDDEEGRGIGSSRILPEDSEDRRDRLLFRRVVHEQTNNIIREFNNNVPRQIQELLRIKTIMGNSLNEAQDEPNNTYIIREYQTLITEIDLLLDQLRGAGEIIFAETPEPAFEGNYIPLFAEENNAPLAQVINIETEVGEIREGEPISYPVGRGIKKIKGGMIDKVWYSPTAMKEYATAIVKGRNDYQPKAREIIKKFGDRKIVRIYACRNPVQKLLTAALNAVSFGQFNKNWENQPYDDLFHLSLRVELDTQPQVSVAIEKTDAVTLTANPAPKPKTTECEFIPLNKEITLNQLLQGGEAFMGNKYFTYSAKDNNCQDYVMGLLRGSNIGTQENYDFIKQNTKELFKNLPGTRKISNTITDIGAVANVVIEGAGKKQKKNL